MSRRHVGVTLPSDKLRQEYMSVVPAPLHRMHETARGSEFRHSTVIERSSAYRSSRRSQPFSQGVVERHVGVAPLADEDGELLQIL